MKKEANREIFFRTHRTRGTWLAQLVRHATLDLLVMSLSTMLGLKLRKGDTEERREEEKRTIRNTDNQISLQGGYLSGSDQEVETNKASYGKECSFLVMQWRPVSLNCQINGADSIC